MNIREIDSLSKKDIMALVKRAIEFKNGATLELRSRIANIFIEPSTRTMVSFQVAQENLKMDRYDLNYSRASFTKGETLEDTLLNLKAIGISKFIIRSPHDHYWKDFQNDYTFINGGDGVSSHPSQALLDAMTIYEHFKTLNKLKVLIIGDIEHSRVFASNKSLLTKTGSVVHEYSNNQNHTNLDTIIGDYDIVMFLRVQHERHAKKMDIMNYNQHYGLNVERLAKLKANAIFMHPGPVNRGVEIISNVLDCKTTQNKIMEQVTNGVYMRMAMIEWIK